MGLEASNSVRDAMERRMHPRVEVSHPVLYLSQIYPRPNVASTLDLSLGGTKIENLYRLEKDERLEMTIAIRPQVIKCKGKVVHVSEREKWKIEAGIKFEKLSGKDRLYLRDYLFQVLEGRALAATLSVE